MQTTRINLGRHKKRCLVGTLYFAKSPNFSTGSRADLNFHIAKKHSLSQRTKNHKCQLCHQVFCWGYSLRLPRQKVDNAQNVSEIKNVVVTQLVEQIDVESSKEDLETFKLFLVDSDMKNGRHEVLSFAMEILDAHTLSHKLDTVFESLKCSAKLNVSFGLELEIVEDGTCQFYYAHGNNTLMDRSKLVATNGDLVKIKNVLNNTDVIEACIKAREKSK